MDDAYFNFIKNSIETNDIKNNTFCQTFLLKENLKSTKYTDIPKDISTIEVYNKKEEINIIFATYDIFIVEYDKDDNVFIHWCWGLPYLTKKQVLCSLELFLWARNQSNISFSLKELLLKNVIYLGKKSFGTDLKIVMISAMTTILLKPTAPICLEYLKIEYKNYFPSDSTYECYSIIYDS
jgi:hypothetical protein